MTFRDLSFTIWRQREQNSYLVNIASSTCTRYEDDYQRSRINCDAEVIKARLF